MLRRSLALLLVALFIGLFVSLGATTPPNAANPFAGKVVLVERGGWRLSLSKDVRVETVANGSFVVLPMSQDDVKWEQWINLDDVDSFKVFENMEDANKVTTTKRSATSED